MQEHQEIDEQGHPGSEREMIAGTDIILTNNPCDFIGEKELNDLIEQAENWKPDQKKQILIKVPPKPPSLINIYQLKISAEKEKLHLENLQDNIHNISHSNKKWKQLTNQEKSKLMKGQDQILHKYNSIKQLYQSICFGKKILTPYNRFYKKKAQQLQCSTNLQITFSEMSKQIGRCWKSLPEAEKQQYYDQYEIEKMQGEEHLESSPQQIQKYKKQLKKYIEIINAFKVDIKIEKGVLADNLPQLRRLEEKRVLANLKKRQQKRKKKEELRGEMDKQYHKRIKQNMEIMERIRQRQIQNIRRLKNESIMEEKESQKPVLETPIKTIQSQPKLQNTISHQKTTTHKPIEPQQQIYEESSSYQLSIV